jgi:hypothetical protein
MSPQNKYDGFFSRKDIDMGAYKPDPLDVVKSLMHFAGEFPNFYKHENQRMIVAKGIHYVTDWMVGEKAEGRMPEIHLGFAAFMMMLAQIMEMTYEEYAGQTEREQYPFDPNADADEDFDS